jgi:peptide/nickel transport system substrate-binding protein
MKIASTDPLTIELYSDNYYLEVDLVDQNYDQSYYPNYTYGTGAWHNVTLGWLPEAAGELAFSAAKADELEVEWMSYIGGPSLDILAGYLEQAAADNLIPYAPTMSQFITEDEAATRWANLQEWYRRRGHFWLGTGPYYLEGAFPIEGTVIVNQYAAHPDSADRWSGFTTPKVATVEVDGPGRVDIGAEAAFDVFVTFQGEPYPADEITGVSYLVFDATGALVLQGDAEAAGEGQYTVTLSGDQTSQLQAGANRLDVVVVSRVVAIPATGSFEFVTQ